MTSEVLYDAGCRFLPVTRKGYDGSESSRTDTIRVVVYWISGTDGETAEKSWKPARHPAWLEIKASNMHERRAFVLPLLEGFESVELDVKANETKGWMCLLTIKSYCGDVLLHKDVSWEKPIREGSCKFEAFTGPGSGFSNLKCDKAEKLGKCHRWKMSLKRL